MSLVWHIVRKDFRRLRWPLLLWLVIPVVHWTLLTKASGSAATGTNPAAFEAMAGFSQVWAGLTWVIGGILAAWLVMEDGLVSTRVFWRTRPVAAGRLFAAKVLGATLMFIVLPVLLMTPIWVTHGFTAREWALAAADLAAKQALFTAAAFAIACVTETAGQFLVRAIGVTVLVPLTFGYCTGLFDHQVLVDGDGPTESRWRLVVAVFALTPLVIIVHQYLTSRRARSYALLAAGVVTMFAVRFGWQWDLAPWFRKFPAETALQNPDIRITLEPLRFTDVPDQLVRLGLSGSVTGAPAGTYVEFESLRDWWQEGPDYRSGAKYKDERLRPTAAAASQVVVPDGPSSGPVPWKTSSVEREETLAKARADASKLQVAIRGNLMRGRVLGELPLRAGAVLRSGSSFTRITGVERVEGRLVVWVEERMAWPPWSARVQDSLLLSNPAVAAEPSSIPVVGDQGFEFGEIWLHQCQVSVAIPMHEVDGRIREIPGWEESARLVKVRFTPEQEFTRILTVPLPANAAR